MNEVQYTTVVNNGRTYYIPHQVLSTDAVSRILGISRDSVRRLLWHGRIWKAAQELWPTQTSSWIAPSSVIAYCKSRQGGPRWDTPLSEGALVVVPQVAALPDVESQGA